MEITGSYSRLTPRYPVSLPCALVHTVQRRWPKKPEELLIQAEFVEISLTGMAVFVPSVAEADRYRLGSRVTFRVSGLDGQMAIRHIATNNSGLRLGGEFLHPSPELDQYIQAIVTSLRG
jgi:hypothetical protein